VVKKITLPFFYFTVPAIVGYVTFFLIFYSTIGDNIVVFSFVPPLVVAWIGGPRRGAVAAVITDVVTLALLDNEGLASWDTASILHRSPGLFSVILISMIVGYLRDMRERAKKELENRKLTEQALIESEARFKAIYEGANDALMLLSEKGFFDCNPRTLELFGFKSREEFTKVHPADLSPPYQPDGSESFPAAQERIGEAMRSGSNRFEWIHRKTTGEDFPAEVLLSAFTLNGKQVLQATVRDISKRKKAEESIAESEKSFRSMFEVTSDGVALINPTSNRFIGANPAMCSLFGYTENEFLKLTAEDITPPEAKEIMRNSMILLLNGGHVSDHEGVSLKKDGTKVNVIVCCRQLVWKGEQVFYLTFKDITFLKDIQRRLEDKNREILEFTHSITHDLKKPLSVMKTICSLIKSGSCGTLNDDGKEAVKMGAESISYMQELLDDLLASAQLEAGVRSLTIEEVDLHELALDVAGRLKYHIEEKKVTVRIARELGVVKADKKDIAKVFMNLIGNAINYIGEGAAKKIDAGVKTVGGNKIYYVRDNGIGIPEETKKTLFQKFKRGSNVGGINGTGLGLSIVKGIIEAHGGKIWVESKLNEGTTFYFTVAAKPE
jgi:PAS domain S-box-containing protein